MVNWILIFFLPFIGYIYTTRYGAAAISFIIMVIIFLSYPDNTDTSSSLYFLFLIFVVIENIISLRSSRQINQYIKSITNPHDAEMTILKLLKSKQELGIAYGMSIASSGCSS